MTISHEPAQMLAEDEVLHTRLFATYVHEHIHVVLVQKIK